MASLLKFLKRRAITAFKQVLVCPLALSCFARHVLKEHTADLYHRFWFLFPHWVLSEFYLSWHVIDSTFILAALPREVNVHFKESIMLLREIHFKESLVLPRETDLAFPREQTHLVSLHHLPTLTQNNCTLKFILTLTLHSLFAITQPLATSAMTFGNLFQVAFDKRTKALQLQMGLVLVFKKGLSRFDSSTMQGHSIFSFWTTVCVTRNRQSIFFPRDISQRNISMPMGIQTKRLASNPDTQLMFLLGLLDSSRRHF